VCSQGTLTKTSHLLAPFPLRLALGVDENFPLHFETVAIQSILNLRGITYAQTHAYKVLSWLLISSRLHGRRKKMSTLQTCVA
jgi:hypothetical protein